MEMEYVCVEIVDAPEALLSCAQSGSSMCNEGSPQH